MSSRIQHSDLAPLISLVHHRWNIPIVAELHRHSGAKFVTMIKHLDVSRASLSASLADLVDRGLVCKNKGYGHPMRPEYLLTRDGKSIGEQCLELTRIVRQGEQADLAFRKWTLPLVAAIGNETRRFNEVRSLLVGATPRAIAIGLKSLSEQGWASRSLIDEYPPTAGYRLMHKGQRVLGCVEGLY